MNLTWSPHKEPLIRPTPSTPLLSSHEQVCNRQYQGHHLQKLPGIALDPVSHRSKKQACQPLGSSRCVDHSISSKNGSRVPGTELQNDVSEICGGRSLLSGNISGPISIYSTSRSRVQTHTGQKPGVWKHGVSVPTAQH